MAAPYHHMNSASPEGPTDALTQLEADEALARQLQRQEMEGISTPLIFGGPGSQAPAVPSRQGSIDARQTRLNVVQNGVREVRSASFALLIVILVNMPQVIAAVVILSLYWNDNVCGPGETFKWRMYAVVAATRMFLYVSTVTALFRLTGRIHPESRIMKYLGHMRNGLDAFGLVWFVVGNMWLFGASSEVEGCSHPERSRLYQLCASLLVINYIQLLLPCVIVIVMLPVLCFCLPCLIRVLARLQDPMRGKGASQTAIGKLPSMKYRQFVAHYGGSVNAGQGPAPSGGSVGGNSEAGSAAACAICISEFTPDDDVRLLPCSHFFHNRCVDEWLRINASCPTCRQSILPDPDNPTPRYGTTNTTAGEAQQQHGATRASAGRAANGAAGGDHLV